MKRAIILFYCFLLALSVSHAQKYIDTTLMGTVRTILLHPEDSEIEAPLLHLGGRTQLMLQFDQLLDEPATYSYRIVHCDRDWNLDDLTPQEYMMGFDQGIIDEHQFSFTTLQSYIHYEKLVPESQSEFLVSGNYALIVTLQDEPDSILFTRRFRVVEDLLDAEIISVTPSEYPKENQELAVSLELHRGTDHTWAQPFHLAPYLQQNGRLDETRLLPFHSYKGSKLCYQFKKENIFPGGSCFRFFDFSNIRTPMYNVRSVERFGGETFVMLKPDEVTSRKNYNYTEGLTGGWKINVWDRTNPTIEADYAWINFSLPMEHPLMDGTVHILGGLTDWTLGDNSRMEWNPKFKAYTKRLYLKQGYYSYQLIFLPLDSQKGETARIEGNHYETPNTYTLYVYGRRPSDKYDRLICVKEMKMSEQ